MKRKILLLAGAAAAGAWLLAKVLGPGTAGQDAIQPSPFHSSAEPIPADNSSFVAPTGLPESDGIGLSPDERALPSDTKAASLADSVRRLRRALDEEDFARVEEAGLALAAMLDEPGSFAKAMALFQAETDPALLAHLARILGPHFALAGPEVQAEVLAMARGDSLPAKRSAALGLLSHVKDPSPDAVAAVAVISREDESPDIRLNAIYTMGHWADNPAKWEEVSHELVKTIDAAEEPAIRGNAIQVIALRGGAATDAVLAAMVDYLAFDPAPKNRAIAALALGRAPPELRQEALLHLETAFETEPDLDVRRNIMTQIARAGEDALPILLQLTTDHPLLEQDVMDYLEILQSGNIHPDNLYSHKFALDAERDTIVGSSSDH